MRIVHLITRLILGGAQENTLLTCEDLLRVYGDDVLLVTGPPLGPEGSLLARAQKNQVPLDILPALRREIHPLRDAASYWQIKRAIRRFAPDVVHTHSGKAGLLGRVAAHALQVPAIVHTVHGAPFHPYQSRGARAAFRACERYAARRCDALVSVADAMTDLMVAAGVAGREKFTTIYSGMEVEQFLCADEHRALTRAQLGYTDEHIVVGKIARLFRLKGHEYVMQAARQVVDARPDVRFLLVGDGVLSAQIRGRIRRLGLDDYFQFTGLVPPERIPALIGAMDIVVHASLREGLARVLPQALIAGKAVISYDVDGAREVVIDDETGLLIPPQTIDELAAAVLRLAGDATLRAKLGAAGRERFSELFRHERMTRQLRSLYEQILARKHSASFAGAAAS
jgi:glycosyltransferase involved in cell wall biosynthesis